MKINLKSKKGFTAVDLSIAMIIVLICVVIMTSISYNVSMASMEAKRTAVALNYAVDIFEYIGTLDFSNVKASSTLLSVINGFEYENVSSGSDSDIVSGKIGTYKININIKDYKQDQTVKIITLTITYPVSRSKTETLELQRIKTI